MPTNLEDLILRIDVDSRRLRRELRRVQQQNGAASKKVGQQWTAASKGIAASAKSLARFTGVGAVVSGAFSAAALTTQAREALDFADSIDKTADRLGLSTDALQEFRFAADQSGVAMRTLDLAIQRFTRRSGEAANGTGEARDAIAELGLELRDSEGQIRRTEDLFSDAIAALGDVDVPAERLRLAFKLFDSEGVAVLQMVENFEALRAKARDLGVVLDRQTIQRAVEAKDEFAAVGQIIQTSVTPALVDLARSAVPVAEAFASAARAVSDFRDRSAEIEAVGTDGLSRRVAQLRGDLDEAAAAWLEAQERFQELSADDFSRGDSRSPLDALREAGTRLGNVVEGQTAADLERNRQLARVRQISQEIQNAERELARRAQASRQAAATQATAVVVAAAEAEIDSIERRIDAQRRLAAVRGDDAATREVSRLLEVENLARQKSIDLTSEQGGQILALSSELSVLTREAELYAAAQSNVTRIMQATRSPLEILNEGIRRLQEDAAAGRIEAVQLEQGLDALNAQFQETQKGLRDGVQSFEETFQGLNRALVSNFARSMSDMLFTGELTFQALAQSFARDFLAATIQTTLLNAFFAPAQAGGGGILGQVFSLGGARAMGGPVRGGVPYLVGERGPEVIVPRGPGFVQPASAVHSSRSAPPTVAATPVVVRVINNSGSDAQVSERRGPTGQREIDVMIEDSVRRNIASGGSIAQAIHATTGTRPRGA